MSVPSFIFGGDTGETPDSLKRKRAVAAALLQGATGSAPRNVGEGLNAIGQALAFRIAQSKLGAGEATAHSKQAGIWEALTGGGGAASTGMPSVPGAPDAASPLADAAPKAASGSDLTGDISQYAEAIKGVESGGKYDIVGPTHPKYGRALGAYQVMEANLPEWSQAALGRKVSADEFLANPSIQDAVFANRFGGYVDKYGNPQDAASAWLTGRPRGPNNKSKDVYGTDSEAYVSKFNKGLGGSGAQAAIEPQAPQDAPVQIASSDPTFMPQSPAAPPSNATSAIARGFQGARSDGLGPIYDDKGLRLGDVPETAYPGATPYVGPGAETGGKMPVYDDKGLRMEDAGAYGRPQAPPSPAVLAALNGQAQPQQSPAAGRSPVAAALAGPSVAPLPPAQTVGPNPVPPQGSAVAQALAGDTAQPGMDDPRFDPRTSPQMRAAMLSGDFDGLGFQSAQAAPSAGSPASPAAAGGMDQRKLISILSNPWASDEQRQVAQTMLSQSMKPNEYGFETMPDGTVLRMDKRTGQATPVYQGKTKPIEVNGRLVDPVSGQLVADYSDPKTATVGDALVDIRTGKPIYQGAGAAPSGYRATPSGSLEPIPGGPADPAAVVAGKPGAGFENEQGLRKEYTAAPEIKEYAGIRSAYESLRASATTQSGPGDLGVIFGYMKMLDPASVVREGEFANAENSSGIPERISNLYNKLLTGERLTPSQRKEFVSAAGNLYGQVEKKARTVNDRFSAIASQYKIDPSRVIQALPSYEPLKLGDDPTATTPAIPDAPTVPSNGKAWNDAEVEAISRRNAADAISKSPQRRGEILQTLQEHGYSIEGL